jgi:ABC-type glycerol-3-phosphate transport system substrate-binding protein
LVQIAIALFAIALVLAITLAPRWGRSERARDSDRTQVEVWSWNIAAKSLDQIVPAFEAQHPDTQIVITRNGTNMQSRLLLSLAADTGAPDVTQLQQAETPKFIQTKHLLDITERAQKHAKDFPPAAWGNCVYDGRTYAIPWDIGPCAVFYRRSILAKYSIDPEKIETWDDYIDAGKKILQESGGKTQMLTLPTADLTPLFFIMMQQNGGGVFNPKGELILTSKRNVEVLETIRRMLDAGIGAPFKDFTPEQFASFATDAVATHPRAVWMMLNIKQNAPNTAGDWGVFRLPAFTPGGLHNSNLGGSTLCIPAQSPHAQQAWNFVEYALCTVEGQVEQYKHWGIFPAYLPALRDAYFDQGDPFFANQKVNRLFATDIEKISPMTRTRNWNDAERLLRQTLSDWAQHHLDNDAYLRDLQSLMSRKFECPIAPESTNGTKAQGAGALGVAEGVAQR